MADWYYSSGGKQFGPITEDALRQLVAVGQVRADEPVRRDDMSQWTTAGAIFPPPAPVARQPPGQTAGGNITIVNVGGAGGGAVPSLVPGVQQPKGLAIASMVLGIISLAMFCAWYLSIPCAIVGATLGGVAISKANRGEMGGKSMATAGLVCSIVSIALDIVIAATVGAFIASIFRGW